MVLLFSDISSKVRGTNSGGLQARAERIRRELFQTIASSPPRSHGSNQDYHKKLYSKLNRRITITLD